MVCGKLVKKSTIEVQISEILFAILSFNSDNFVLTFSTNSENPLTILSLNSPNLSFILFINSSKLKFLIAFTKFDANSLILLHISSINFLNGSHLL